MASSVKSDDLVSRVLDVNDVDLKEIEGHESEKVNKTSIHEFLFVSPTRRYKRIYQRGGFKG